MNTHNVLIIAIFTSTVLFGCKAEDNFSGLEESGAFLNKDAGKGLPVLTHTDLQKVFASSLMLVDVNNETAGNDDGMTYACVFDNTLDVSVAKEALDCSQMPPAGSAKFDSATGVLQWTPSDAQLGSFEVALLGENKAGTDRKMFQVDVVKDTRPVLTKIPDQLAERGKTLVIDLDNTKTQNDSDMEYDCFFDTIPDRLVEPTKSCEDLPGEPTIKFDSRRGVLAWLPDKETSDSYEILVVGRNSDAAAETIFAITVIDPRGETLRLSSVRDEYISEPKTIIIDVDNVVTGDDFGIKYECYWDSILDGAVSAENPCTGLPGTTPGGFNVKKGLFTWQPNLATASNVEVIIMGEKSGVKDQEIFVVVFDQGSFGQIGNSALSFDPPSHNFGNVMVSAESATKTVVVTNDSSHNLHMRVPEVGNANFQMVFTTCPTTPAVLEAAASCIVGLKFTPTIAAQLGTTVLFKFGQTSTATDSYEAAFGLSGNGIGNLTFAGLDSITNVTHNSLKLNWTSNADAVSYIIFKVQAGGALEFIETIVNTGPAVNNKTYIGLFPNTAYKYRVRATDVFGVTDGNSNDIAVTTLVNRPPQLPALANPDLRGGQLVPSVNVNDTTSNSDLDEDGDIISYSCTFDNVIDGAVADGAALCTTILNEGGTNPSFNTFTGVFSNWRPRHADVGVNFEVRIRASDTYAGNASLYLSGTVQAGQPLLEDVTERIFADDTIEPGQTVAVDLNNIRFGTPDDDGMTYSCSFKRHEISGPGALQDCSLLPGGSTLDTATGEFEWTPDASAVGSYQMTFSGTNGGGTHSRTPTFAVIWPYTRSDTLADFQAAYADLKKPGVNGAGFTALWKSLDESGVDGSLTNFSTATAWGGVGSAVNPYHLTFDGTNDNVNLGTGLNGSDEHIFEGWIYPSSATSATQVILSNGDDDNKGYSFTNRTFVSGSGETSYAAEVLADSPARYYRFTEMSGTTAVDSTGSGLNGVITVPANVVVGGISGIGEINDASITAQTTGYLAVPSLDINASWAIEAWFKYPFPNGNCGAAWCTLTRGTSTDHQVIVSAANLLGTWVGAAFRSSGFNMTTLAAGWHHLVASQSAGVVTFYINGNSVGSHAFPSVENIVAVGNFQGGGQAFGSIDEVALYTNSLSPARIAAHYAAAGVVQRCDFSLLPNYWYHLAGLIDKPNNKMEVFINGLKVCSKIVPGGHDFAGSAESMLLGRSKVGAALSWAGKLSELRWHNSVDANLISTNFNAKKATFSPVIPIPPTGLRTWIIAGTETYQDTAGTTPATANDAPVALAKDIAGYSASNIIQATAGFRPLLKTGVLNGRPVLQFDGIDDRLQNVYNYTAPSTMFYVGRILGVNRRRVFGGTNNNWLLGFYNGATDRLFASGWILNAGPVVVDNQWIIYAADLLSNLNGIVYRNGNQVAVPAAGGTQALMGLSIGGSSNEWSNSQVAAVVIYDRVLSTAERQAVMTYLNGLYNVY